MNEIASELKEIIAVAFSAMMFGMQRMNEGKSVEEQMNELRECKDALVELVGRIEK